jgi:hypothetical protein
MVNDKSLCARTKTATPHQAVLPEWLRTCLPPAGPKRPRPRGSPNTESGPSHTCHTSTTFLLSSSSTCNAALLQTKCYTERHWPAAWFHKTQHVGAPPLHRLHPSFGELQFLVHLLLGFVLQSNMPWGTKAQQHHTHHNTNTSQHTCTHGSGHGCLLLSWILRCTWSSRASRSWPFWAGKGFHATPVTHTQVWECYKQQPQPP